MSPSKTPPPSVSRGGRKLFPSFIRRAKNGWMEGWKSCDPRPSLSPSALQPPAQISQQQPLATLAQGHWDKVRGRGERGSQGVCVCVCAVKRVCVMKGVYCGIFV